MFYYCAVVGQRRDASTGNTLPVYAELHAHSAYTFAQGAATPEQMVKAAKDAGLNALGLIDIDGMYSAIQADHAGKTHNLPIIHGVEFTMSHTNWEHATPGWGLPNGAEDPGIRLPILARNPDGYRDLCQALSTHNLAHPEKRATPHLLEKLAHHNTGNWLILTGSARGPLRRSLAHSGGDTTQAIRILDHLCEVFGRDSVAVESQLSPTDSPELGDALAQISHLRGLELVATGAAYVDVPKRQALADVLTATRLRRPLQEVEAHLVAGGRFIRSAQQMMRIHRTHPEAVTNAGHLGVELAFDMSLLTPQLPTTRVPKGHTDASWLRELTYSGAQVKYGSRQENPAAWQVIDKEIRIIESLDFPGYFLIVKDIVDFCARQGIWCQGRGSAANSAVCYALDITAVDAVRHRMMFERFLSQGRSGPPDIDIDIESDRREEVIQYVYATYGRENAAQVGTVLTYRPRSAVYDAARALGYNEEPARAWSRAVARGMGEHVPSQVVRVAGALRDLPRHTGIHSGGMVLTRTPVSQVCPVMWAATPGRTVLQWDKEDCADAGLVKFDLLGLGMLSALRRAFTWLEDAGVRSPEGRPFGLHHLPAEDSAVYDLLCAADAIGVFQVESRAQLNTLPRMQPRCFYDLVIEVALIRPGPIQGQSVNPYLRRRRGEELVTYPHDLLRPALEKTLGVPLFQEQLMQIAVDIAGFSPGEADELRRAMGAKRSAARMAALEPRLLAGMAERGITGDVADEIVDKLHAFADFGFPESHSFSFAFLVYASAWLKVYAPEFFYAGVIASQPMGFYSVSSLVHDARRHGVRVERPDVNFSQWGTHVRRWADGSAVAFIDEAPSGEPGEESALWEGLLGRRRWVRHVYVCEEWEVRLGLDQIRDLPHSVGQRIAQERSHGEFVSINDCVARCALSADEVVILAKSGAFSSLEPNRRQALWLAGQVGGGGAVQPTLPGLETVVESPGFAALSAQGEVHADYESLGVSAVGHPFAGYRAWLNGEGVRTAVSLGESDAGRIVEVAGVVTHRQSPATGKGVVFLSVEDETGLSNVTCSVGVWKRYGPAVLGASAVRVRGMVEYGHGALNVLAHHIDVLPDCGGLERSAKGGRGGFLVKWG